MRGPGPGDPGDARALDKDIAQVEERVLNHAAVHPVGSWRHVLRNHQSAAHQIAKLIVAALKEIFRFDTA